MTTNADPARALLARIWTGLGGDPARIRDVSEATSRVPLPARTDVSSLAWASVAAASLAASDLDVAKMGSSPRVGLDSDRIAVAYSSERYFRLNDETPSAWAPLSGFFRASDGWVRTHGNYPHHAAALRRALGLSIDADANAAAVALRNMPADAASRAIVAAGGLCVTVARANGVADTHLRSGALVGLSRFGSAEPRVDEWGPWDAPLRGIRVLDLTRVIAGPVATRTLALLGADVLRIDPPQLPESEWQHFDSGHGKLSTLLDLTAAPDRARFDTLLSGADVVVTGYRAEAFDRIGMSPAALIARRPGLVVARLTAWGASGAQAGLRGFDSLVQAASGIGWIESVEGERPGALPAQALDHSAGYLIAAGVLSALARRVTEGGSWIIDVSLRRVAAELLHLPMTSAPSPDGPPVFAQPHLQHFDVDGLHITTTAPAVAYDGGPTQFSPPRRWGRDAAQWR